MQGRQLGNQQRGLVLVVDAGIPSHLARHAAHGRLNGPTTRGGHTPALAAANTKSVEADQAAGRRQRAAPTLSIMPYSMACLGSIHLLRDSSRMTRS